MKKATLILFVLLFSLTSFASIAPITGSTYMCQLSSTSLTDATPGGTWSSSATAIATVGSVTGIVTGITAGTATITYTVGSSYVTATVSIRLTVSFTIAGRNSICTGEFDTLTVIIPGPYLPLASWTPTASLSCVFCDTNISFTTHTQLYYASILDSFGCQYTDSFLVTVNPLPVISVSPYPATVCLDSTIQLHASGGATYLWLPATGLSCDTCSDPFISLSANIIYEIVGTGSYNCTDSFYLPVTVDTCFPASVPVIEKADRVEIFPNPSAGLFTLHITSLQKEPATITITNMLGEKVKQFIAATNEDIAVQADAAPGIYFVTAVTKNETITKKIIIE